MAGDWIDLTPFDHLFRDATRAQTGYFAMAFGSGAVLLSLGVWGSSWFFVGIGAVLLAVAGGVMVRRVVRHRRRPPSLRWNGPPRAGTVTRTQALVLVADLYERGRISSSTATDATAQLDSGAPPNQVVWNVAQAAERRAR